MPALKGPFISIPHVTARPIPRAAGSGDPASALDFADALRSCTAATIHATRPETIAVGDAPIACGVYSRTASTFDWLIESHFQRIDLSGRKGVSSFRSQAFGLG